MKVYRFETKDGGGVYRGSSYKIWSVIDEDNQRHPYPFSDDKLFAARKALQPKDFNDLGCYEQNEWNEDFLNIRFFGFESVDHASNWFYKDEWLLHFHNHDIVIAVYEVEDDQVLLGEKQLMFIRTDETPKQQFNIIEFFNLKEI